MLTIEVASIQGEPPPVPMLARFEIMGGWIGRDPDCTLVLPDPGKRISRRHALIGFEAGGFFLRNRGSAIPVLLNGVAVEYGAEAALADGDCIDIGGFALRVQDEPGGAATIPPSALPTLVPSHRDRGAASAAAMPLDEPFAATAPPDQPVPAAAEGDPAADTAMMLSWQQDDQDGVFGATRTMVIGPGAVERRRQDRRRAAMPAAATASDPFDPDQGPATGATLQRALLEGLGLDRWPDDDAIDAEAMRRVGGLLRTAVQGTLDLLRARAMIKSAVQAQLTQIVARDNNPLKFSPNAEAALAHLLAAPQRGFMDATAAMEDAYLDLVAHQFGFTAGTRAALADVLNRFDPQALERRLEGKSVIGAVLPAHRKAKLWDLFTDHFEQIARQAEDDFQRLFGREFLRAYEEQVAELDAGRRKDVRDPGR